MGECKGNIVQAAARMGISPRTARQHYNAGMRKLGRQGGQARNRNGCPRTSGGRKSYPRTNDAAGVFGGMLRGSFPIFLESRFTRCFPVSAACCGGIFAANYPRFSELGCGE